MIPSDRQLASKDALSLRTREDAILPLRPPKSVASAGNGQKMRIWLWGACGLLSVAFATLVYLQFFEAKPRAVVVETATLAPVTRVLAVNGRIAALHPVEVRSAVTGSLTALLVSEGDFVAEDQILAQVDNDAQTAIVKQADAAMGSARVAQQEAAEAYDRAVFLGDDIARTVREASAHDVQTAGKEVARQIAALDQAKAVLETYTIRAPIAGKVVTLEVEDGQIVGPSVPLLTLADLGDLVVEADVDEVYAAQIVEGQSAVLQMAGETGTRQGHLSFVSTRVDVATGGLAIKISYDSPVKAPIGMTVTTNIIVEQRDAALTVPRTAMYTGDKGTGVFLVENGAVRFQSVSPVDWPADRLIVTEGLTAGDVYVTDTEGLVDGQAVTVERH